ncbi:MAG TPA: hypothetical protein VFE46_10830 [Pirellulales bacterium]|nr:hypothetical protein [Pirellulales bacterium]
MQRIVFWLALASTASAISAISAAQIDVPVSLRQENDRTGSCAHAEIVTQLRFLGEPDEANQWWTTHSGGENASHLNAEMDAAAINHVDGHTLEFIREANAAGHLVQVEVYAGLCTHALIVSDITSSFVRLIDCNHVKRDWQMPLNDFKTYWTGWAFYLEN